MTTTTARRTTTNADTGTVAKRRISWEELYKLRPDLKAANGNDERKQQPRRGTGL